MTNKEKKEILCRYRFAEAETKRIEAEIERWRTRAEKITASYKSIGGSCGDGRNLEEAV